jgi:predicted nucleic acid-binding protein
MDEVLIDTNILVYAHQPSEAVKYERALRALETLMASGVGRLSAQILGEFLSATTRGRKPILTIPDSLNQVTLLSEALPVFDQTHLIVLEAGRGVHEHQLTTSTHRSGPPRA